jgi:hypothetical protein
MAVLLRLAIVLGAALIAVRLAALATFSRGLSLALLRPVVLGAPVDGGSLIVRLGGSPWLWCCGFVSRSRGLCGRVNSAGVRLTLFRIGRILPMLSEIRPPF